MPLGNSAHNHCKSSFQLNQNIHHDIHLVGHSTDMATTPTAPTFTRYRDHHQIIRAIEKCSLQATFGPEITSTGDLLPKEPDVSSVLTLRSSHDTIIRPIEERDEVPFDLANSHSNTSLLPIDPTNEDGNVFSDPTIDDEDDNDDDNESDDVSVFLPNQDDNIHSRRFTNGSTVRPTSEREDGMTLHQQQLGHSHDFGRVRLEILDQKVSYRACNSLSISLADHLPVLRSRKFANGPTRKESIATSMIYLIQITSTQIIIGSGTPRTFFASAVRRIL